MKNLLIAVFSLIIVQGFGQFVPNYEESKIPDYELPPLFITENGKKVETAQEWWQLRRPELLRLFSTHVYGFIPEKDVDIIFDIVENENPALGGLATRKQVKIIFTDEGRQSVAHLLIYLPFPANKPAPVFLGYNFYGNHTIFPDPEIIIPDSWTRNNPNFLIMDNSLDEKSRGWRTSRWPLLNILKRGYGLAVMYYGDIDPDYDDNFMNGIHPLFYKEGQTKPEPDEWGSIGAWAYGLSRAMDYFEKDKDIDQSKVAVIGHSRLGKTSLWAGARDDRFAMVISNESGCGGAALSRRKIGETVERINTAFPHWFCDNFNHYNKNEEALPIDQHQLIALIAPRPVYIASAAGDEWADPKGEFLAGYRASPVYELFGLKGLESDIMPEINQPVKKGHVGYHIRSGDHDLTYFDWEQFLDFADMLLK